jgi:hypothetical protein
MNPSQPDNLFEMYRINGWTLTLDQLTSEDAKRQIGVKHTNRNDDLRKRGYKIDWKKSDGGHLRDTYTLVNPSHEPKGLNCVCRVCQPEIVIPAYYPKGQGQGLFVLGV